MCLDLNSQISEDVTCPTHILNRPERPRKRQLVSRLKSGYLIATNVVSTYRCRKGECYIGASAVMKQQSDP